MNKECGNVPLGLVSFEDMFSERICDEIKVFEVSEQNNRILALDKKR